jgi:hypothetical protein
MSATGSKCSVSVTRSSSIQELTPICYFLHLESVCKVPYESYAFAEINMADAEIVSDIR